MANRFWVGGSANWDASTTTNWSTTSGGAGGASVPTSADNVIFDGLSNATAYTVTITATANCLDMTWALPGTSGVPTLAGSAALNIFGSLTNVTGLVWSCTGALTFSATSVGKTITSAGVSYQGAINFNGAGGEWTLQDTMSNGNSTKTINFQQGIFKLNGKTLNAYNVDGHGSGTRAVNLTNGTVNILGGLFSFSTITNLTFTSTGSAINVSGGAVNTASAFDSGGLIYNTISMTGPGLWTFSGSPTISAFSYASTSDKRDQLILSGNITIANNGTLSLSGNSVVNRAFVLSSVLGTQRIITISGTTVPTLANVDFQDVLASGNTPWTGTSLGDALGNSGITFDPSVTLTYLGGTHNWSDGAAAWSGTTNRTPLPQDDVVVNTTTAGTLTADMPRLGRNLNFTSFTRVLGLGSVPNSLYGNLTLGASMTFSGSQGTSIQGRGAQTLTNNGNASGWPSTFNIQAFGGTYTAQDGLINGWALQVSNGTFDGGVFNHDISTFTFGGTATREIRGSGVWTISSVAGTRWNVSGSGATISLFTGTIKFTNGGNAGNNITFAGNGLVWPNLWWSNTAATGTLIITGANTFNDFKVNRTTARGIQFPAGATNTIASWTDESLGTAILTVTSSSPGTPATLSKPNGAVSTNYLSLQDSAATGGAAWYAGSHSTNVSGNSGWIFADYVPFEIQAFQDSPPQVYWKRPYLEALMGGQVLGPPPQPIVIPQGGGGAYPHFTHGDGKRKKSVRPIWDKGPAPPAAVETAPEVVARAPDPLPAIPTGPSDITGLARLLDPPAPIRREPPKRKARSRLAETGDTSSGQAVITTLARCSLADHADTSEASVSVTVLGNSLLVDEDQGSARVFVDIAGRTAVFDTDIGRATVSTLIRARGEARDDPDTLTAHATWDDDDLALRVLGLVNGND